MQTHPGYQAALDYIYSFINYETKQPPSKQHAQFNLLRLERLLGLLGDPHRRWPSVVIAGTKGKGSTAAMIEAMLRAAGYRTGLFSSPHLHSWRERIQVNRQLITQADVVRLLEQVKTKLIQLPVELGEPTTFELATVLGFTYFAEQVVDIAVLEVGLGGRYDTVNVVTPLVSVITPISFDHMATLGNTLEEIAGAKAGIIKTGVPVISAPQAPAAHTVIQAEALAQEAPLFLSTPDGLLGAEGNLPYPIEPGHETIGLRGAHQIENAWTALGAVQLLQQGGYDISIAAMRVGLHTVQWPGRAEVLSADPLIIVDGAMNRASAERLRDVLHSLAHERLHLILGTSADKDVDAIAGVLVPEAATVIVTRSRHPRSAPVEQIVTAVTPYLHGTLHTTDDIPEALALARELAKSTDVICVTGSLFVVAAAREVLGVAGEID